ncbi:MAG TPA: NADP-dependent oxidoreductase [Mycobacteriales bacterium]|nr:NADP-dependent oxidoreductase [Mycobacteriales bacterium]
MTRTAHTVQLIRHRTGREPAASLTASATVELTEPGSGEVLVRTTHLQLTAVLADLMREDPKLPMYGFQLGAPMWAPAIGVVVESHNPDLPVGTVVQHRSGWQDLAVLPVGQAYPVDSSLPSPCYALNQGVTAYHGMVDIADVQLGDIVFVSGAAGGVGSMAGQVAKALGAERVIGSAGGPGKAAYLVDELGYDVGIDYRAGDLAGQLRKAAPEGVDVFFDLVGGAAFEAAVDVAAPGARFALCGAVSGQLDDSAGAHPRLDVMQAIVKELVIRPFCTRHTAEQLGAWSERYSRWLAEGKVVYPHTTVKARLDQSAAILDRLLAGEYRGNVLVELKDNS